MERREERGGVEREKRRRAVPFTVGEGRQQSRRAEGSREEERGGEWQLFKLLGADTEK